MNKTGMVTCFKNGETYYFHSSSYIDDNVTIGDETKIWHFCHIMENVNIGKNCSIGQNVVISPNVKIGDNCRIQNNVSLYEGLVVEDDVFIGPSCVFTNVLNPRSFISRKDEYKKTILKKGCSIGANATIVCGNIIGEYSLISAGSVITKDVEPNSLMMGIPTICRGKICKCGNCYGVNNEIIECENCKNLDKK